jgi:hypothetical protein
LENKNARNDNQIEKHFHIGTKQKTSARTKKYILTMPITVFNESHSIFTNGPMLRKIRHMNTAILASEQCIYVASYEYIDKKQKRNNSYISKTVTRRWIEFKFNLNRVLFKPVGTQTQY